MDSRKVRRQYQDYGEVRVWVFTGGRHRTAGCHFQTKHGGRRRPERLTNEKTKKVYCREGRRKVSSHRQPQRPEKAKQGYKEHAMTEHLFKLMKDGKAVGYLRLKDGWTQFHSTNFEKDQWYYPCGFKWTSAHSFVTKDKNGKDVFADDEVDSMGNRCLVMWHKAMFQWCLWHIEGDYYFGSLESKHIIELIEDKGNE